MKSPLSDDRKAVCEPIAMGIKDALLAMVDGGIISMREAADVVNGLHFAFTNMVKIVEATGGEAGLEALDMLKERD